MISKSALTLDTLVKTFYNETKSTKGEKLTEAKKDEMEALKRLSKLKQKRAKTKARPKL